MMILLAVGRFRLDLAEVARLKNVFLLLDVDFCEILEELLICDFLRDLLVRLVILELFSDLLDSKDLCKELCEYTLFWELIF